MSRSSSGGIGRRQTWIFAAACGLIVANIYFAQPLTGPIGRSLSLPPGLLGFIVTITQLGYAAGLLLLVPLGDLVENRRLIATTLIGTSVGLAAMAFAPSAGWFLAGAFAVGVSSVAAQMLVPFAAQLAPDESRGRVVGNVMSGLMAGILLGRPVASMIAGALGWRWVFGIFAGVTLLLSAILARILPQRRPDSALTYSEILRSLWTLLKGTPVLQRRAAYQWFLFGSFSLFWTAVPLLLAGPKFGLEQHGIGLFALAGAAGTVVAPIAGRFADRGWTRASTGACIVLVVVAFTLAGAGARLGSLWLLVASAIILDIGVAANLVLGQRAIFSLAPQIRSRLNGIFIAVFFLGGAAGSAGAGYAYARDGWEAVTNLGIAFGLVACGIFATEFKKNRSA